jgi:hypothetical protein
MEPEFPMPRLLSSPGFFVLAVFGLIASPAIAQSVPERFLGIWKEASDGDSACAASDWDTPRHSDSYIRISPRQIDAHESRCRISSIDKVEGETAIRLHVSCNAEGSSSRDTQVWQVREFGGQRWLSKVARSSFTGQWPYIRLYRHCPGEPSSATVSVADSALRRPPAGPPVQSSTEYRNLPAVIRKEVEEIRRECKEMQAENKTEMQGIRRIRVGGSRDIEPAILVDNLELCEGDQIGANCTNWGSCPLKVWTMRRNGTWGTMLNDLVYERVFDIDENSGIFVSMNIVLNADRPPCRPRRGAVFNKGDRCRVTGSYRNGMWTWKKIEDLRN